jgi:hypothetical protein
MDYGPRSPSIGEEESFVNSLPMIYARSNGANPLMANKKQVYQDFRQNFNTEELIKNANSSFMGEYGFKHKLDNVDNNVSEVDKASETGKNDSAMRNMVGKLHNNRLSAMMPVKGLANGNSRFNGRMMAPLRMNPLTIDDRGEGVQPSAVPAAESFTPTISCNSRLAGSSMNIEALTGSCFKKYDTESFFENNTPFPPKLNIMEGGPKVLKYKVNDTM